MQTIGHLRCWAAFLSFKRQSGPSAVSSRPLFIPVLLFTLALYYVVFQVVAKHFLRWYNDNQTVHIAAPPFPKDRSCAPRGYKARSLC